MMNVTSPLESLVEFANTKKLAIDKKRTDSNKKTSVGLWWDSKIPKKDKWIFNCISFKYSNKEEVDKDIIPFIELYNSICELESIQNATNDGEDLENAHYKVNDLYRMLSEMVEKSETKLNETSSSCIYQLCKDLRQSKGLLEEKLDNLKVCLQRLRVKNLSLKFNQSKDMFERTNRNIDVLLEKRAELKRNHDEVMMKINQVLSQPR